MFHKENWGNSGRARDVPTDTVTQDPARAEGSPETLPLTSLQLGRQAWALGLGHRRPFPAPPLRV